MTRPLPFLRRLGRDERGAAAIEYGVWSVLLFSAMLGAADFGLWRAYQLRLSSAIEQAGMIAIRAPNGLAPDALKTYVQTAAALPGTAPTVTIGCNGGSTTETCPNSGRTYYCISSATPATYTAATGSGVACTTPANTTAGYYMTISASYTYTPLVLPNGWLSGRSINDKLTLRLE